MGWDIYNNHSTYYHYWKDRCAVNAFSTVVRTVRSHEFLITGFAGGGGGGGGDTPPGSATVLCFDLLTGCTSFNMLRIGDLAFGQVSGKGPDGVLKLHRSVCGGFFQGTMQLLQARV